MAGVVQWQNGSFPSFRRGFDSLHPLHSYKYYLKSNGNDVFLNVLHKLIISANRDCSTRKFGLKSHCKPIFRVTCIWGSAVKGCLATAQD